MSYNILALDGGGTWALIQVKALIDLYGGDTQGHDVLSKFQLVAANSAGALTVAGLLENWTLNDLLEKRFGQLDFRKKLFVDASFLDDPLNKLLRGSVGIGAKYNAAAKLTGLQSVLSKTANTRMSDLPALVRQTTGGASPEFLLCAFDFQWRRARYFRSDTQSLAASNPNSPVLTLAEAIHASTNAPVNYFDAPAQAGGGHFWDGGVAGLNNPVLAAVTEALANNKAPAEIQVLSLGTATQAFLPVATGSKDEDPLLMQPLAKSSIGHDVQELAESILDDPPDAASFIAYVAMGGKMPDHSSPVPVSGRLIRMNPMIMPSRDPATGKLKPPTGFTADEFHTLAKLSLDAIEDKYVTLINKLASGWINGDFPNQPIRMDVPALDSTKFKCQIGHAKYSEARNAWLALSPLAIT